MSNRIRFAPKERAFRRLCRILGSQGQTRWHKQRRASALADLEAIPARQRHALFARCWKPEEKRRRRREQFAEGFRLWGAWGLLAFSIVEGVWFFALGSLRFEGAHLLSILPIVVYNGAWSVLYLRAIRGTGLQRGMARRLLWEDLTTREVGYLVDMLDFTGWLQKENEDDIHAVLRHLTRLLGDAVGQDATTLDLHQKKVLRAWIARAEPFVNVKTAGALPALETVSADFIAVALLALRDTGGWQTDDRETRAARRTIQKIADAPPLPDEPANHRYVRDVARETLPLVPAAKGSR